MKSKKIGQFKQVKAIWDRKNLHARFRRDLEVDCFNRCFKCRMCGIKKDLQIHHIYEYGPQEEIFSYKEFKEIPWIPLCRKCHINIHRVEPPEMTEDD